MINNVLKPLVNLFNNIKFRTKILIVSVLLFLPMLFPIYKFIQIQSSQKEDILKSKIGLLYNRYIYDDIILIARHRGLTNGYDGKNQDIKKAILKIESDIDKLIENFIKFDKKNLKILTLNSTFIQLFTYEWEFLKLENLPKNFDKVEVFKAHSQLINKILSDRQERAQKTHFYSKELPKLNYIAEILSYQIPSLSEIVGKLRGMGTKIFLEKKISEKQKNKLIGLISTINEKIDALKNNKLSFLDDRYINLNKHVLKIIKEFNKTLYILDTKVINNQTFDQKPKQFFNIATKTITELDNYYKDLEKIYLQIIDKKQASLNTNIISVFLVLAGILLLSIYIILSLYVSIKNSLKVLQTASINVLKGDIDKKVEYKGRDEIADAINTFSKMGEDLKKNMTFLDNYKYAIDNTSIVSKTDHHGIITYVNKRFCEISGYKEYELIGRPHNIVRHPDMPKEIFHQLWQDIRSGKTWKGIIKNKKKNGKYYVVDATIIPMYDNKNNFVEYVAVMHDITEMQKQKDAQLYDSLTNLPKREKLLQDIKIKSHPVLITLNIKNFSSLNKFYGYETANRLLVFVSKLLKRLFSNIGGIVYKLHADEFAVLIDGEGFTQKALNDIVLNYLKIIESTDMACSNTNCINISLNVGIAIKEDESEQELLLNADLALKEAKQNHKKIVVFDSSLHNKNSYIENMAWIKKIEQAIKDDRIIPFYQPIVDNRTNTIQKYESLVRMIDKDGKVISPFFFLEIAKKSNLYHNITKIMIQKSFEKFQKYPNLEFSINLTAEDIKNSETVQYIFDKLKSYRYTHRIIFEIVESEEIDNYDAIKEFVAEVKRYGVKIAIDDFGSGFSSFERILKLKPDYIKIDGSIIKNIDQNLEARVITNAIVAFSHNLKLKVVAEYIHSKEIFHLVKQLGCDYSQGFYLGEPSPKLKGLEEVIDKKAQKKQHSKA